jgi:alpha-beta hydrolase superfamily lysophospholipase
VYSSFDTGNETNCSFEVRILPRFDSKGNIELAVRHLCNWLLLNATLFEFGSVIILAHSMGGLLAIDVSVAHIHN